MKHEFTTDRILAALALRTGGKIELSGLELDAAAEIMKQNREVVFIGATDAAGNMEIRQGRVALVRIELLPSLEAAKRMQDTVDMAQLLHDREHAKPTAPAPARDA